MNIDLNDQALIRIGRERYEATQGKKYNKYLFVIVGLIIVLGGILSWLASDYLMSLLVMLIPTIAVINKDSRESFAAGRGFVEKNKNSRKTRRYYNHNTI
jgi:hypothetical protein